MSAPRRVGARKLSLSCAAATLASAGLVQRSGPQASKGPFLGFLKGIYKGFGSLLRVS